MPSRVICFGLLRREALLGHLRRSGLVAPSSSGQMTTIPGMFGAMSSDDLSSVDVGLLPKMCQKSNPLLYISVVSHCILLQNSPLSNIFFGIFLVCEGFVTIMGQRCDLTVPYIEKGLSGSG